MLHITSLSRDHRRRRESRRRRCVNRCMSTHIDTPNLQDYFHVYFIFIDAPTIIFKIILLYTTFWKEGNIQFGEGSIQFGRKPAESRNLMNFYPRWRIKMNV